MCDMRNTSRRPPPKWSSLREVETGSSEWAEATARRPRRWKAIAFIIGLYAAVSMAINAFGVALALYLVDRYNMKEVAATDASNIFSGTLNFSPVVGAFVADALWGRFRTLTFGTVLIFAGMVVITLSATIRQLTPPVCSKLARQSGTCAGPSGLHRAVLYIGMALLVVGIGGANPTGLPFGVDQFDETNERHKRGLQSYYNWYLTIVMMSTFLSVTFIVYIQERVSWGLGFAIPTGLMLVTFVVFLLGTVFYVYVPPEGSIFSSIARVLVASCKKWRLQLPHPHNVRDQEAHLHNPPIRSSRVFKLPLTLQFRFLNKAAIVTDADDIRPDGSASRPWNLCSVQEVEELKCLLKIIPLWIAGTMWFITQTELSNYTLIQSITMDLRMGKSFVMPKASILSIFYISVALFAPIYDLTIDRIIKRLRKSETGLTLLQRQGAGIVILSLALVAAANVEQKRRSSALDHGGTSPMSVFWLTPQLAVLGISGAFTMVGQLEFYNTQFPEQMRALGNSAFYCAQAAASYLATLVVNIVNSRTRRHGKSGWINDNINAGRLDYFYYTMAVFGVVNLVYFLICAHFYQYKGAQLDSSRKSTHTSDADAVVLNCAQE